MGKETALSSFLASEYTPDAGKHPRKRTENDDQLMLKGSNDAVSRIDTNLVSLEMIVEHDCHLSNQHGMVMPCMSGAAVGPFLCAVDTTVTRPTPVRCCQLSRRGHFIVGLVSTSNFGRRKDVTR